MPRYIATTRDDAGLGSGDGPPEGVRPRRFHSFTCLHRSRLMVTLATSSLWIHAWYSSRLFSSESKQDHRAANMGTGNPPVWSLDAISTCLDPCFILLENFSLQQDPHLARAISSGNRDSLAPSSHPVVLVSSSSRVIASHALISGLHPAAPRFSKFCFWPP